MWCSFALPKRLGGVADLFLSRQKHEHIAAIHVIEFAHCCDDAFVQRELLLVVFAGQRSVAYLDRIAAARHLDDRRAAEEVREALRIDRRGSDDDSQLRTLRQDALQHAEQKIDVEAALVRFINDERVIATQQSIVLKLAQQNAVGHQLHTTVGSGVISEANLIADGAADG